MSVSIPAGPPLLRGGRPGDYSARAVFLDWFEYINWLKGLKRWHMVDGQRIPLPPAWMPGQHWANIGKTREGKSNYVVALLKETRKYVIVLDPKGEDPTLSKAGWPRVTALPNDRRHFPKDLRKKIEDPYYTGPIRMIVGLDAKTRASDEANKRLLQDTLEYARQSGGWTVYVDEHQVATDPRMFNLGPMVARMAVSAASAGTSIMTSMQYIGWSEKAPVRQASFVTLWKNKSRDLMRKASEELGRDWRELAAIVDELDKYDLVTFSDEVRAPIVLTRPPKI